MNPSESTNNVLESALELTDELHQATYGEALTDVERLILQGTWEGITYEEIAAKTELSTDKVKSYIGSNLLKRLGPAFGVKKITKSNYADIVRERLSLNEKSQKDAIRPRSEKFTILGGQPPNPKEFFGRSPEMSLLQEASKYNRCLTIRGSTGIGKSCLAAKLVEQCELQPKAFRYEHCIWKSISHAPKLKNLLHEILNHLELSVDESIDDTDFLTSKLIKELNNRPFLIVIDAVEAVMTGKGINQFGDHIDYQEFFSRMIKEQHHGTLLLTSQEPISLIDHLEKSGFPSITYHLGGLNQHSYDLLRSKGLKKEEQWEDLIMICEGNPLILSIVASRIIEFFNGNIKTYMEFDTTATNDIITITITKQLERSSEIETEIINYLANQEIVSFEKICKQLRKLSTNDLIVALKHLEARSMITKSSDASEKSVMYKIVPLVRKIVLAEQEYVSRDQSA